MVLSDRTIKEELSNGHIVIDPLGEDCIQPASVDLRLGNQIRKFEPQSSYSFIDVREDVTKLTTLEEIPDPAPFILEPGQFILGTTVENVELPNDVVARLEGKSSLGRLGLLIHSTAGYIDPGWKGQLTLEISNVAQVRISLYSQMKIGQISFLRLSTPADKPYGSPGLGSKYQGQYGPTASRSHIAFQSSNSPGREYSTKQNSLSQWLKQSSFHGSIPDLADAMDVPSKTVEDWVYGRGKPNKGNALRLFELTGLPAYAPEPGATQSKLFLEDLPDIDMSKPQK